MWNERAPGLSYAPVQPSSGQFLCVRLQDASTFPLRMRVSANVGLEYDEIRFPECLFSERIPYRNPELRSRPQPKP